MSLLGTLSPRLIDGRLIGQVIEAIEITDHRTRLLLSLSGHIRAIGTHIRDQTNSALLATNIHALIEALGQGHCLFRAETELTPSFLLERAGGKRRSRAPALIAADDLLYHIARTAEVGDDRISLLLVLHRKLIELLPIALDQHSAEGIALRRAALLREISLNRPILLGDKRLNRLLALNDQAHRHRLDTPSRQPTLHLIPEQRAELVANEPVENAAGLLGVNQVTINLAWVIDRLLHRAPGDLLKDHTVDRRALRHIHRLGDVPRDCLALAVGVSREIDRVGTTNRLAQVAHHLRLRHLVDRLEVMLNINREIALRQIANVAHTGGDSVALPEIFLDRFRLCWRLNDDNFIAHRVFLRPNRPCPFGSSTTRERKMQPRAA